MELRWQLDRFICALNVLTKNRSDGLLRFFHFSHLGQATYYVACKFRARWHKFELTTRQLHIHPLFRNEALFTYLRILAMGLTSDFHSQQFFQSWALQCDTDTTKEGATKVGEELENR